VASPEHPETQTLTMAEARARVGADVHVVGVIGSPVAHSLSPLLHNTAFEALGLADSWRSFAFEIAPGDAAGALEAMRAAKVSGLSVTMPHKGDVEKLVDECSDTARRLGAVNCVMLREERLTGVNTDGEGFVASLARGVDFDPAGRRCVVIGAGGAARAIIYALKSRGFERIAVVNRTQSRAEALAAHFGGPTRATPWSSLTTDLREADLLVNTSVLGMAGQPPLAVDPSPLPDRAVVADIVYVPLSTPLIEAARARGLRAVEGLGMLLHQAAPGFARWFGARPTVTPALRALVEAEVLAAQMEAR
jgi:shikimate dehydrogenase